MSISPNLRLIAVATSIAIAPALAPADATAQDGRDIGHPTGLAGVERVAVRASAVWDELITTTAGGATGGQFEEALSMGFRDALAGGDGPTVTGDAPGFALCHVDTFYDSGLIVYAVRTSYHRPDSGGRYVVAWLQSEVGSFTAQQLHLVWTLGERCADSFLGAWNDANG